jgi:steroid delta-isomerase
MSTVACMRWARDGPVDLSEQRKGVGVLSPDELRHSISRYVEAINRRDPQTIAALFTEDAVQADPASNPANVGRAAIATFFEGSIAASDTWTFTAAAIHTCAANVAIDFRIELETGGSGMTIEGIEVFTFGDDGLISSVYAYWDDADLSFG